MLRFIITAVIVCFLNTFEVHGQSHFIVIGFGIIEGESDTLSSEKYLYDKDTVLLEETIITLEEEEIQMVVKTYDNQHHVNKKTISKNGKWVLTTTFERDTLQQLSKQIIENEGGIGVIFQKNTYNQDKKLVRTSLSPNEKERNEQGNYVEFEYDIKGNLIKQIHHVNKKLLKTYYYKYNEQNQRTEELLIDEKLDYQQRWTFSYNTNAQRVIENYIEDNQPITTTYFSWQGKIPKQKRIVYHEEEVTEVVNYSLKK